jgi:hypothetical protein
MSNKDGGVLPGKGIPASEGRLPDENTILPGEGIPASEGRLPDENTILPGDGILPADGKPKPQAEPSGDDAG